MEVKVSRFIGGVEFTAQINKCGLCNEHGIRIKNKVTDNTYYEQCSCDFAKFIKKEQPQGDMFATARRFG